MKKVLLLVIALVVVVAAYFGFAAKKSDAPQQEQAAAAQPAQKLYVYNWTEYITSNLLKKFAKETGIEVVYSTYESNEEMYAKLKLNQSAAQPYDIVVPSNHYVQRLIREGLVRQLDLTKLDVKNIIPGTLNRPFDPENKFSVPYTYGFTTLAVNKVDDSFNQLSSWADLWKPEYKDLVLIRDQRDVFSMALKSLGLNPNTTDEADIQKAYEHLKTLVNKVKTYNSDAPEVPFVNGDVNIGMIWTGSAFRGQVDLPTLDVVWPTEGAIEFIDSFMIPKDAKNVDAAYKFINFLLQPENAAEVVKALGFQPANQYLKDYLPVEWHNSKILFPPAEVFEKATFNEDLGDEVLAIYNKYWNLLAVEN